MLKNQKDSHLSDLLWFKLYLRPFLSKRNTVAKENANLPSYFSPSVLSILLLAVLSLIWGSSFILIKKSLLAFSPLQVFGCRIGIAGIAFFPFFMKEIKKLQRKDLPAFIVVGLFGSGFPAFLYALGQQHVSSSIAGLLNSLTPLFTLLIGLIFFQVKVPSIKIVAVFIGLLGAILLVTYGQPAGHSNNYFYAGMLVIATICYAISLNTVGKYLGDYSAITISSIAFGIVTIPAILVLFNTNFVHVMETDSNAYTSLAAVAVLSLLGTFIANILFYKLVQITNPLFSSMVSYLIPMVAIAWGVVDGELITIFHFIGFVLILCGVYLSKTKKKNR